MFSRVSVSLIVLYILSFNVPASALDNPFAKSESLYIGKDVAWKLDNEALIATKSTTDGKGTYYHLVFDNKQIKLLITSDVAGEKPKQFSQLEITDVIINGKQSALFKWCLNNQERHNRFLQQDLSVKNDVCKIDSQTGTFVMRLNKDTLTDLKSGQRLLISLKPFRIPLELNYDISDFEGMYAALNAKPAKVVATTAPAPSAVAEKEKMCHANAAPGYTNIKPVEYPCSDSSAKLQAETLVAKLESKEQKIIADKKIQLKLAEEKKQKELAAKLLQEQKLQAEAAAIAASEAKQAQLNDEIAAKMIAVCNKFWEKGESRCYCEKYIEHAPSDIQANPSCK